MPPIPKKASQRRRQNKVNTEHGVSDGLVRGPELTGEHSPLGTRFWESLRTSGQAQWFQDSDWAAAELVIVAIDSFVEKPSASMLISIQTAIRPLLVTEGDRRRLHLELERASEEEAPDVSELAEYRNRLKSG